MAFIVILVISMAAEYACLRAMYLWGHAAGERDEFQRHRPQPWEHEE